MKVGDYVRTKYGISKYKKIVPNAPVIQTDRVFIGEDEIIKSSPNIIDLIEVGDYVNGREIDFISKEGVYSDYNNAEYYYFEKKDIKSIVTKEQFEQMGYKVGEIE